MGKKAAAAPDYTAAAEKQGQSSKEVTNMQTYANRPDQVTPFGTESWTPTHVVDPATGQSVTKWTQTTKLNPAQQQALDNETAVQSGRTGIAKGMMDRVSKEYGPTMDWSKFVPEVGKLDFSKLQKVGGGQQYNDAAGKAIYDQFSQRNEPIFARERDQTETRLRNQGLNPGDEAYDNQMAQLEQQHNDARTNASLEATKGAGAEASRLQGMDTQAHTIGAGDTTTQANFQNTGRQQQIAEEMSKRGFSLNEINALLTGQQVGMPSMPGFQNATKSDAVQYSQAAGQQYSAAQDAANASNANISGVAKIAGSAAMMSDRRLKTDIELVGVYKGHKLYTFRFVWGEDSGGVMADEVPQEYVSRVNGFSRVDYGRLFAAA